MQHSISPQLIKQLAPTLCLYHYNQIPIIALQHPVGSALISLQGAQLLSWTPTSAQQDVIWLSEVEPFQLGQAIRGGIPLCYPWFGPVNSPAHGTARIRLWHLADYQLNSEEVRLVFCLFDDDHLIEAKLEIVFNQDCQLTFQHYGTEAAQVALHSYFRVGEIEQIEIQGLPTTCLSNITKQVEQVPSPRVISENVDCIYPIQHPETTLIDQALARQILLTHHQASDVVLWNPWHKSTSNMSKTGYKTMVCIETGRISHTLNTGDQVSVTIKVRSN